MLLTADAETNVTGRLTLPPVEAIKVAHHGSRDDGLGELLEHLGARVAVISVGSGNDYGHPTPSTLAALEQTPAARRVPNRPGRCRGRRDRRAPADRADRGVNYAPPRWPGSLSSPST